MLNARPLCLKLDEFKSCIYCYVRCATLIAQLRGMSLPQIGASYNQAQLGLLDKGLAIKWLVICYVVWLGPLIYEMGLWTSARCVVRSLVMVRMAIELKYRKTQLFISTDTYQSRMHVSLLRMSIDRPCNQKKVEQFLHT